MKTRNERKFKYLIQWCTYFTEKEINLKKRGKERAADNNTTVKQKRRDGMSTALGPYKLLLLGDEGVGKTALFKRNDTGTFDKTYIPTAEVEISALQFVTRSGDIVVFNVWDFGGGRQSAASRETNYNDANCAIIVFDVTSPLSLERTEIWRRDVIRTCGDQIPMILVGNKYDLSHFKHYMAANIEERGMNYSSAIFASAKTSVGCVDPFSSIAKILTGLDVELELVESETVENSTI